MRCCPNIFEAVVHGIFLILGLITVGCVLLITICLIISGIPAIRQIGLFHFLFGKKWASTAAQAARLAGISRTAFYKYRDAVFSYDAGKSGGIVTVHLILQDNPGVLSALLAAFADAGANILTVNQNIPAGGVASVSISARTDRLIMPVDGFVRTLGALPGVERITRLTGEGITGLRLDMPGA